MTDTTFAVGDVEAATAPLPRRTLGASLDKSVQASSHPPETLLVDVPPQHGFVAMVLAGWAQHYPIAIRPDDVWLLVLQGVAQHVAVAFEQTPTQIQERLVGHARSSHLRVESGEETVDWPRQLARFRAAIDDLLLPESRAAFEGEFSTTTATDTSVATLAIMDACSHFITYEVFTKCGFPTITLRGTAEDWRNLRVRAEALVAACCLPAMAARWSAALLPVLDRFVAAKETGLAGDELFWNSFLKRGAVTGSGAKTFYNGWVHVFFPYLAVGRNGQVLESPYCVPYSPDEAYVKHRGPTWTGPSRSKTPFNGVTQFPRGVSKVPIKRTIARSITLLQAEAGFFGVVQDPETLVLECLTGWAVADADDATRGRMEAQGNTTLAPAPVNVVVVYE